MPKRIPKLRTRIMEETKAILLAEGFDGLHMRRVAIRCGVALGTLYNYYPSKDMLAASVMLEDWLHALDDMRRIADGAQNACEALNGVYGALTAYASIYRGVWSGYPVNGNERMAFSGRHRLLVSQLAEVIAPAFDRFCPGAHAKLGAFYAENMLVCLGGATLSFSDVIQITERIAKE